MSLELSPRPHSFRPGQVTVDVLRDGERVAAVYVDGESVRVMTHLELEVSLREDPPTHSVDVLIGPGGAL